VSYRLSINRLRRSLRQRWDRFLNTFNIDAHQLSHATAIDRYPSVFQDVARLAHRAVGDSLRVLSFGCSTGEECATLRNYFPGSTIIGTDVSPRILRVARQKWKHLDNVTFVLSSELLDMREVFDVVFAMSVLCKHPETEDKQNIASIYPFQRFEEAAGQLSALVRAGGLIVIFNSNYHFEDTAFADSFEAVDIGAAYDDRLKTPVVLFAPDGARLEDQSRVRVAFRRLPSGERRCPSEGP